MGIYTRTLKGIARVGSCTAVALVLVGATRATQPETFRVDPVHTSVLFRIKHLGVAYFYGMFTAPEGSIVVDPADPTRSSVEIRIPTESLSTHETRRDDHLKSPDFFDAKQFPVMSFKSKSVKKIQENIFEVTGDFTLHGVKKTITLKVEQTGRGKGPRGEERIGFHTVFTIKRSDFGMTYMLGENMLSDEVQITLSVEAIRQ
ncbi:MAG: YceI family protein [bacterium JZ-2024 1]